MAGLKIQRPSIFNLYKDVFRRVTGGRNQYVHTSINFVINMQVHHQPPSILLPSINTAMKHPWIANLT